MIIFVKEKDITPNETKMGSLVTKAADKKSCYLQRYYSCAASWKSAATAIGALLQEETFHSNVKFYKAQINTFFSIKYLLEISEEDEVVDSHSYQYHDSQYNIDPCQPMRDFL